MALDKLIAAAEEAADGHRGPAGAADDPDGHHADEPRPGQPEHGRAPGARSRASRARSTRSQASYDSLVSQESELQSQLDDLEAQEQAKQAELTERQQILAERLVAAYKTDQTPLLTQLLTSGSLTDALSDVSYYMDLGAQDKALAEQIQAGRDEPGTDEAERRGLA